MTEDELITKNAKLIYANGELVKEVNRLQAVNARLIADAQRLGTEFLQNRIIELETMVRTIRDLVEDE